MDMSTSISVTFLDENGNELPFRTSTDHPVEILIPRDPTLIVPAMFLQNVTSLSPAPHQLFHLHLVDLSEMSDVSVHLELRPLSIDLSYLLIYRFDQAPILIRSLQQIDGWSLFCPASETRKFTTLCQIWIFLSM